MANILTPISLWKNFNDQLEVMPVTLGERVDDGVKFESVNFSGRDTGMGRVTVYGVLATKESNPSKECVLIFRDSNEDIDEEMLRYFVKGGYSALCVDYAGEREGVERHTVYPENVDYANAERCGRYKDYVDYTADKTCWYEWVAVGVYARKYLKEKFSTESIGLIGVRDGGEIVWKLAAVAKFSCAVTISACGWRAYKGYAKFEGKEPEFTEERYRFIAGIDSQAYAPYVRCPMLILCTTNDASFDYDRVYDTYSRINPEFAELSAIAYSVNCGSLMGVHAKDDLFLFLDSNVKDRHVFMPKPVQLSVFADDKDNLVAKVVCDSLGIIVKCGVFFAEDSFDYSTRDWSAATLKSVINPHESEYYLDVYEKSSVLFALCYAVYSNGFTVWSKILMKKISGNFRNGSAKTSVVYTSKNGTECFSIADCSNCAVGGIFLTDEEVLPQIVTIEGLKGIYSKCGLTTNRIKNAQYSPDKDSILKFDVCSEEDIAFDVSLKNSEDGEIYTAKLYIIGGVWQSVTLKDKTFKNHIGVALTDLTKCESLTFIGSGKFALNNLIWL